ncbi:hypothetical protein [Mycobacterium sp. 94-17]|uniref:hypothetical protein n=1 Tax=Mycobacterium sp. 94-17 TaxID=2986147 RepID=UPI002D1F090C|nr:hypothetical protein [Mycobacterium sp. 94-17]MEB4209179.1 hypothetical protein [Mycobacterium sp. 94-17]
MTFVLTHHFSARSRLRARSMLRAGRLLTNRFHLRARLTPEERANLYVSRMPIAMVTASLGGHVPGSGSNHR